MSVFIGVTGYSLGMSLGKNSIVKQPLPIDNNMAENDETENKDKVEDFKKVLSFGIDTVYQTTPEDNPEKLSKVLGL